MAHSAYDVVALGGGPGGNAAALAVKRRGGTACVVERAHLGGNCLNVGCMPTKAMLAASDACWRANHAERFGLRAGRCAPDGPAVMRRVAEVIAALRDRTETGMAARVAVVRGRGRLDGPRAVVVETEDGTRRIEARNVVIATGARPVKPPLLPWGSPRVITTDEATVADDLPESAIVMGGGAIGCEFATIYAELGVRTVLVEMLPRLVSPLGPDASKALEAALGERGVEVLLGRRLTGMTADEDGVTAELEGGETRRAAVALVAVGRRANVEDIALEAAGVELADGVIPVDDRCRTNVAGVYAVGDCAEKRQYAHLAERMGVVAGENIMGAEIADDRRVVPVGVYSHPEVAAVGLSREAAEERFGRVKVLRYPYRKSTAAQVFGETDGQVTVVADPETGLVHGAVWIGPHATDLIHELALAVRHGLSLEQIYHTIHAHPTYQEAATVPAALWIAQARRSTR
jgi:dihydrolipoamide dehydrogenase